MTDTTTIEDPEFVGYRPAAKYLGIAPDTLSSYMGKGLGPAPAYPEPRAVRQYNLWVFRKSELDRWKINRRPGARTDLYHAGLGQECKPCEGSCLVDIPD